MFDDFESPVHLRHNIQTQLHSWTPGSIGKVARFQQTVNGMIKFASSNESSASATRSWAFPLHSRPQN